MDTNYYRYLYGKHKCNLFFVTLSIKEIKNDIIKKYIYIYS